MIPRFVETDSKRSRWNTTQIGTGEEFPARYQTFGPFWRDGIDQSTRSRRGTNAMQTQLRPTREDRHAALNFFCCWKLHPEAQRPNCPWSQSAKVDRRKREPLPLASLMAEHRLARPRLLSWHLAHLPPSIVDFHNPTSHIPLLVGECGCRAAAQWPWRPTSCAN